MFALLAGCDKMFGQAKNAVFQRELANRGVHRRIMIDFGRNTQRATLQTPQGLDATHGDELFPVKRWYIGTNSGVRRAPFERVRRASMSKNFGLSKGTPCSLRGYAAFPLRPYRGLILFFFSSILF
jgi:hypothetical protein